MEVIEHSIKFNRSSVYKIFPIGDIHCGSIHCAEHEIQKKVDEIKNTPNALWVGMGDYADSILKDDPRFDICGLSDWVEKDNIVECQREWLNNLFTPIKDKCLCLLSGNHEEQIHNRYQFDIVRNLCKDLNLKYGGYQAFIKLKFRRNKNGDNRSIIVHAWHGAGAAQTEGARVMRLMRLVNEIQADIHLMGHLHVMSSYYTDRLYLFEDRIKSQTILACMTGSWLRGYTQAEEEKPINPSYIEIKGYKPTSIGCPVILIKPMDKRLKLEL